MEQDQESNEEDEEGKPGEEEVSGRMWNVGDPRLPIRKTLLDDCPVPQMVSALRKE